ncbi:glycine/D-amino acid oxidase-like deaminating enzyme [Thermocatellispora tengchongensis]|uniref:Glycine/D-amino acid oxidase-like deaminating enzyme n=1 Tax=Thermocatellispora tengchongensis TaxID=1073253 RepID=A0A840PM82_9ACTN|nr:FAD-dependent oxidoreductase [Thermocatellispora tengchongensis]MBB5139113.1 glycine/D-amino acid oxidase-like deaminating enzyme [Thermocatellispora tengchongensis]
MELDDGTRIECGHAVVACGHLSAALAPSAASRLFPVKGEAIEVMAPNSPGYPLRHAAYARAGGRDLYAVPRWDGRLAAGVTHEPGRADTVPTPRNLAGIRRGLAALSPAAAGWRQRRHWAGVRPGSEDGVPLIGALDLYGRVVLATGHGGFGITLAPVTAELTAALITGDEAAPGTADLLARCDPARFTQAPVPAPTEG